MDLLWLSVEGGKEQRCLSVARPAEVEHSPPQPGLLAVGHTFRGAVDGCLDGEELEEGLCEEYWGVEERERWESGIHRNGRHC